MNQHTFRLVRRGAVGFAGILFVLAMVACTSESDGATVSPTATGTPDSSATPGGSLPPQGGAGGELTGVFQFGFEHSGFYPDVVCPADGPVYWVSWEDFDLGAALETETGTAPFAGGAITTYRVTAQGRLSEPGKYGHLGQYERELTVTGLVRAELASDCDDTTAAPTGPVDEAAQSAYEAALARWQAAGIASYRFTLASNCFCTDEFRGPFQITVTDGAVSEALYGAMPAQDGIAMTVDEVFQAIEDSLNSGVETQITYDETLGYPLTVQLDLAAIAVDGGFSVELSDLVPTN